ncbi:MAG: serine/threonine protein kinase [Desulfosarcina sp.]|nr:serine/threonine protein kinase [Desulfobacterales bacterium]
MASSRSALLRTDSLRSASLLTPRQAIEFSRRRLALAAIVAVIVVAAAGLWSHHAVMESVEDLLTVNLAANLNASTNALTIWIENELAFVRSWAEEKQLRRLTEAGRRSGAKATDATLLKVQNLLASVLKESEVQGWVVVDAGGRILFASRHIPFHGMQISAGLKRHLDPALRGQLVFVPPILKNDLIEGLAAPSDETVLLTAAPIRNTGGQVIAALVFAIRPDGHFTRILSASRMGADGDTYAFNRKGYLISDSRFETQLQSIGLVPEQPEARSILRVLIRDPGGNLTAGFKPAGPPDGWAPTRMLKSALEGQSGIDLSGYRDYRGVTVVGAWRWLPDYDFGIAIEVPRNKVQRIQRPIRLAFLGLMGLVVVLAGLILFSTLMMSRLQQSLDEIKQVGHYTIQEKIGEGGMGKVFKATHALLKRPTAIKFLKPDALTPDSLERFEREVQITSRLTHPNTIEVYDYGRTAQGVFYYAMEYLPGIGLDALIALEGAIPPARSIHILRHICFSLEEAHGMGLIHRDIKPPNVMLCERGGRYDAVKVLDFGLVKDVENQDTRMTAMHEVVGTPAYVAPERLTDPAQVDQRADIYSLGAVGFNLLTGADVFEGANAVEICYHVMKTPPPRASERSTRAIPPALDQLVDDCLAKDPNDRPADVKQILAVLDSIEGLPPWQQAEAQRWWAQNEGRI